MKSKTWVQGRAWPVRPQFGARILLARLAYNCSAMGFDPSIQRFINQIFSSFGNAKYEPAKQRCTVCDSLMSPVAPDVTQYGYYNITRKYGFPTFRARVCCHACMREYERMQNHHFDLPNRFQFESGHVYLMRGARGYKIGETESVERRKKELERQYSEPLELLHVIGAPHSIGAEKYLQYRYADLQINDGSGHREWFNLSEREIKYIKSITVIEAWRPYGKPGLVVIKLPWIS
jgi:hypothetical protein